jgi:hypothetical protein
MTSRPLTIFIYAYRFRLTLFAKQKEKEIFFYFRLLRRKKTHEKCFFIFPHNHMCYTFPGFVLVFFNFLCMENNLKKWNSRATVGAGDTPPPPPQPKRQ